MRPVEAASGTRPHEEDVDPDDGQALRRATGGVEDAEAPDQDSTRALRRATRSFGEAVGQDVGYADEHGGERRARWAAEQGGC